MGEEVRCDLCIYITEEHSRRLGGQPERALIRKGSSNRPIVVGVGSRAGHGDAAHASHSLLRRLELSTEQAYPEAEIKPARWFHVAFYSGSALLTMVIVLAGAIAAIGTAVTASLESKSGLTITLILLFVAVVAAVGKGATDIRRASSIDC